MLGQWLSEDARKWISRGHVRLVLEGTELTAQDVSTNGTGIRPGGSTDDDERVTLARDETRVLCCHRVAARRVCRNDRAAAAEPARPERMVRVVVRENDVTDREHGLLGQRGLHASRERRCDERIHAVGAVARVDPAFAERPEPDVFAEPRLAEKRDHGVNFDRS